MNCPACEEDLLCEVISHGDLAVCPECGEIAVVESMTPLRFRVATLADTVELDGCENGHKILMYSSLLKAHRKGLFVEPGNA